METAAVGSDGSVVLTGFSEGVWDDGANAGGFDFVAVKLDASDGTELWRWQVGKYGAAGGGGSPHQAAEKEGSREL